MLGFINASMALSLPRREILSLSGILRRSINPNRKHHPSVNLTDAIRKIRQLRLVSRDRGAMPAEVDNARGRVRALMERFAMPTEAPPEPRPQSRMSWVYWEHLLGEYGLELRRFGKRGNAQVGRDRRILIRLDSGHWRIERSAATAAGPLAAGVGIESLREYLKREGPRYYAFASGGQTGFRRR